MRLAIDNTRAFFELMGMKTRLSDYGIDDSKFAQILKKLAEHKTPLLGERNDIDYAAVERILRAAL